MRTHYCKTITLFNTSSITVDCLNTLAWTKNYPQPIRIEHEVFVTQSQANRRTPQSPEVSLEIFPILIIIHGGNITCDGTIKSRFCHEIRLAMIVLDSKGNVPPNYGFFIRRRSLVIIFLRFSSLDFGVDRIKVTKMLKLFTSLVVSTFPSKSMAWIFSIDILIDIFFRISEDYIILNLNTLIEKLALKTF